MSRRNCYLKVVCIVLVLGSFGYLSSFAAGEKAEGVLGEHDVLKAAAEALAVGNANLAEALLKPAGKLEYQNDYSVKLAGLLGAYEGLDEKLDKSRQEVYQENVGKLEETVERARWRESLKGASEGYTEYDGAAKKEFESKAAEDLDGDWLAALTQLSIVHNLAKRFDLDENVAEEIRQEITTRTLAIAEKFEQDEKWLESYGKVYGQLAELDRENEFYGEHNRQLLRRATLVANYLPDPNHEGVTWEERREGVSADIISAAVRLLAGNYVEVPDFKEMLLRGLKSCRLMAKVDKLAETFPNLNDPEKRDFYLEQLDQVIEQVQTEPGDKIGYYQVLIVLNQAVQINRETLGFPDEVVMAEFIEGAVTALDPYTYVVWPADVESFRKDMTQEFSGIGVVIKKDPNTDVLQIDSLVSYDAAAYEAGLDAGDSILAVDGTSTEKLTIEKCVQMITGPKGTNVVLTVDREGFKEPRDYTVARKRVSVPTVKGLYRDRAGDWKYFVDPNEGIGYLRITNFAGDTAKDLKQAVVDLKKQGLKGLVIDLRNNSGGYLSAAVDIVDAFVDEGVVVSTRSREPMMGHVDSATRRGTVDADLPLVVLVNSSSASASEIVSGSLKDHKRALLVGTRTFGKGNVQTIQPLDPAEIKMTIAYYYLPSGRRVHRDPDDRTVEDYGVEPDITVELPGKILTEMYKTQRDAGILHRQDLPLDKQNWKIFTAKELLDSDPQLEYAVMCLKGSILARAPIAPEPAVANK